MVEAMRPAIVLFNDGEILGFSVSLCRVGAVILDGLRRAYFVSWPTELFKIRYYLISEKFPFADCLKSQQ